METIVVTRHNGLVDYLKSQGIIGEDTPVIDHATPDTVRGKRVIGVLPLHLAVEAAEVVEVPMNIPAEARGKELTGEETAQYAGAPRAYSVQPGIDLDRIERDFAKRGYTRWTIQVPGCSIGDGSEEPIETRESLAEALALAVVYSTTERCGFRGEAIVNPANAAGGNAMPPVGAVKGKIKTLGFRPSLAFSDEDF